MGIEIPDGGEVVKKKSLRIGYVPQVSHYHPISIEETLLNSFKESDNIPLHEQATKVKIVLSKLGFKNTSQLATELSGGWKKRLDLAKELIKDPDILLLDEPTNHLDLEGIVWLEKFLKNESITYLVTSHDRYFLQNVTERTIEINPQYPDGIFSSEGSYSEFVEKRAEFLEYQLQCERAMKSKVKSEVEWLRQTPKARTTKSTARVQEAGRKIDALAEMRTRNRQNLTKIDFEASERQTNKLLTAKNISKSLGEKLILSKLDLTLSPGMRLGIVGPNGCGKTTLLRLLAGEITPDTGTIKYADGLRIVYFDQHRQQLSLDATLKRALSPNSDTVIYRGQSIHVNSWAKRFLFDTDRLELPIKQLSGGERARIGIARLMLQPADLLLLDEPTNDLDIPTLESLEASLSEFPGAIVLITHDRAMLDRLTNCVIGLGIPEKAPPLLADYSQWETYQKEQRKELLASNSPGKKETLQTESPTPSIIKKLTYKEKIEFEEMEKKIITLEQTIAKLEEIVHVHTTEGDHTKVNTSYQQLEAANHELEKLFLRWQELEDRQRG